MINSKIISGKGKPYALRVTQEGTIGVVAHQHPPIDEQLFMLPFTQYFTDDGTATGANDMRVAGSAATPIIFSVDAVQDKDIYIKTISFEIADASATLNKFGNITALTNGVKLQWFTSAFGQIDMSFDLKTNWDFIRLCGGVPAFGDGANSFRASNVSGNSEGYIPFLDVGAIFGLAYGMQLRKGTTDKLIIKIQDNTITVDSFNAIAYGTTLADG
jgi:hypothetical protein